MAFKFTPFYIKSDWMEPEAPARRLSDAFALSSEVPICFTALGREVEYNFLLPVNWLNPLLNLKLLHRKRL